MQKALATGSKDSAHTRKLLDQERRKLQNLVTALEGGSAAPASVLKAIAAREKTIADLERELEAATSRPQKVEGGGPHLRGRGAADGSRLAAEGGCPACEVGIPAAEPRSEVHPR